MRAAAQRLERVPARAAAEVEHPVTGTNPEPGEVDGQHDAAPPREVPRRELPCREVFRGEVPAAGPASSSSRAAASAPALSALAIARRYCSTVARAAAGLPTTVSTALRSVVSFATARNSVAMPLTGESALATATIRPGTRASGRGWNRRVSTPSGITCTWSRATRKSRQMSSREDSEPVSTGPTRRATRPCIRTNPYQRRLDRRDKAPAAADPDPPATPV